MSDSEEIECQSEDSGTENEYETKVEIKKSLSSAEEEDEMSETEDESEDEIDDVDAFALKPSKAAQTVSSNVSFKDIGVDKWLVKKLTEFGINHPTPVQINCIPKVLEGIDVLGCAKTGTGKTLAFALPILQKLMVDPYGVFALVLTPTRELANQIADQFVSFGKHLNLKICTIIGGMDYVQQAILLTKLVFLLFYFL